MAILSFCRLNCGIFWWNKFGKLVPFYLTLQEVDFLQVYRTIRYLTTKSHDCTIHGAGCAEFAVRYFHNHFSILNFNE